MALMLRDKFDIKKNTIKLEKLYLGKFEKMYETLRFYSQYGLIKTFIFYCEDND